MAGKAEDLPLLKPLTEHATLSPYQKVAENGAVLVDDDGVNIPDRPGIGGTERGEPLYRNFLTMCVAFSLNHGCVVSCLAYSTTELGNTLGGVGSGVLYVFYALTAFFLSKPYVSMVGPKVGLLTGCGGYCVYVCGFLFAVLVPAAVGSPARSRRPIRRLIRAARASATAPPSLPRRPPSRPRRPPRASSRRRGSRPRARPRRPPRDAARWPRSPWRRR